MDEKSDCHFSLSHGLSGFLEPFPIGEREFNISNS